MGKVNGKRLPDSRFDHATLRVEVDGRDVGFGTIMDEEKMHYPRLIVNQWETKSYLVHDKYNQEIQGKTFSEEP